MRPDGVFCSALANSRSSFTARFLSWYTKPMRSESETKTSAMTGLRAVTAGQPRSARVE